MAELNSGDGDEIGSPRPAAGEVGAAGTGPGSGFGSGEPLDVCAPGGVLAGLADAATCDRQLAQLDDDELIGVLRAWRRLESWCSAGTLIAIAELARRRPAERSAPAPPGSFPDRVSEFVGDEVAAALTMSARTAGSYVDLALDLAIRLPGTGHALHAGLIDYPRARLISELTQVLSDADARTVEVRILPQAGQQTPGQLRVAVARSVLAVDPEAAARRREEAQKDPRVRRWQEDAGTAALAGYGLPPAEVLRADQRLTDRALALRDAGLLGPLEELRARAYLDILLGQDSAALVAPAPADPGPAAPARAHPGQPPSPDAGAPAGSPSPPPPSPSQPGGAPAGQPRLAARVTLTVPLLTHLGLAAWPGYVAGFGPVDPALARQLTALAAADPVSRFCLTVTGSDGRAVGHGCLPGRRPDHRYPPSRAPGSAGGWSAGRPVLVSPLAAGDCDHRHQEPGYQPSRKLAHLISARSPTCTAPGCQRAAARCDLDHTSPYDRGGRTCECNVAPLCRHHHRGKQSEGWRLEQLSPGVMRWTTPAGRRYLTTPSASP